MTTVASPAPKQTKAGMASHGKLRADIEGLRAVATFLVLPYHAGLMVFPGGFVGVDVFFVISGFVITAALINEANRTGRIGLLSFYARRAKRLLPASALTIVATGIGAWFFLPKIKWEVLGGDLIASSLYYINWHLAGREVDYLAEDVTPSAVQHYWSLAVEEQYYIVWPIVLLFAVWLSTKLGLRNRVTIMAGLTAIAIPSFLWALYQAEANPEFAYFDTFTRMFEFAFGAGVAILVNRLDRMPRWLGATMAWTGLAMVLIAARVYDASIVWPSYNAVMPTLGAAMLIAGGAAAGSAGPVRIIGNKFFMLVGGMSYSLYLWHWPGLVLWREAHEGEMSLMIGISIVLLSIFPAWLSYRFVETPIRYSKFVSKSNSVSGLIGATSMMAGVIAGLVLIVGFHQAAGTSVSSADVKGASALQTPASSTPSSGESDKPDEPVPGAPVDKVEGGITPNPLEATKDIPDLYAEGCQVREDDTEVATCTYGPDDAETTIAVVGDSKSAQWVPAFQLLAETHDWQIKTYTMSACSFSAKKIPLGGEPYENCHTWGKDVIDRLTGEEKPDVVFASNFRGTAYDESGKATKEAGVEGLMTYYERLADEGVKVVIMGDNPYPALGEPVYECVAENTESLTECAFDKKEGVKISGIDTQFAVAEKLDAVNISPGAKVGPNAEKSDFFMLDLTEQICPTDKCAAVIGNVLVYRQGAHITKTYVETLAPFIEESLAKAGIE